MSKTYAIADLHGRFDLLEMALKCLAERAESGATLIMFDDHPAPAGEQRRTEGSIY